MKIGAGGLQAMFAQEAARGLGPGNAKTVSEQALLQSDDPVLRRYLYDLNKALERMRKAAETFHQPFEFELKRDKKPKINGRDRRTGVVREFTLEEAAVWVDDLEQNKGSKLNGYA